jgi:hypothetical protein
MLDDDGPAVAEIVCDQKTLEWIAAHLPFGDAATNLVIQAAYPLIGKAKT